LETKLKEYRNIYGEKLNSSPLDDPTKIINEHKMIIEKLEVKIAFLEKTQNTLLSEIDTIGSAWAQLEAQNARKVLDLIEKEDMMLKLLSEVCISLKK
jgi:hypothetical protein